MSTDAHAAGEIERWGAHFLEAIDALREGEGEDVARRHLLGDPDQSDEDLNYRLWMMLPVAAWIGGQLLARATPEVDGSGWFGLELADTAEPSERLAGQLVTAAANDDDDHVMALIHAERNERGWQGVADALGAVAAIAAPMWDRKPVDL